MKTENVNRTTTTTLENDVNLVRKIAWAYAKTTGIEFDDLFSEACIAYLEAEKNYDSKKSKKSTYMHHVICRRLNSLLKIRSRVEENEESIDLIENPLETIEDSPEYQLLVKEHKDELFAVLSPEALTICNILLEEPNIYLPIDKPKQCRGVIYQELRKRDWSWSTIWKTFNELKQVVASMT